MENAWHLRPLVPADIDLVCRQREAMFVDVGRDPAVIAGMTPASREWFGRRLETGEYFGFVAESAGRAVGGVGLLQLDWPPHFFHPTQTRRGYVLNMYVDREFRRRGLARALMEASEAEFRRRGLHYVVLHASDQGRPLYESMGWTPTNEMSKRLG
jgi:ribosomal protein S18 acetylase RimI-like enzyme